MTVVEQVQAVINSLAKREGWSEGLAEAQARLDRANQILVMTDEELRSREYWPGRKAQ